MLLSKSKLWNISKLFATSFAYYYFRTRTFCPIDWGIALRSEYLVSHESNYLMFWSLTSTLPRRKGNSMHGIPMLLAIPKLKNIYDFASFSAKYILIYLYFLVRCEFEAITLNNPWYNPLWFEYEYISVQKGPAKKN